MPQLAVHYCKAVMNLKDTVHPQRGLPLHEGRARPSLGLQLITNTFTPLFCVLLVAGEQPHL
jgi:hypothetical protein